MSLDIDLENIRVRILKWYQKKWNLAENRYPWRTPDRTAYEILVAELLLQHTTAKAIIDNKCYENFLKRFPSFNRIKTANIEEIEKIFKPIGLYHQKSDRIKKLANIILEQFNGVIPTTKSELMALPGIGDYIASALMTFAFNKNEVPLDGNLKRITKIVWSLESKQEQKEFLKKLAVKSPKRVYWALFDIGRFHCRKPKPNCLGCPLGDFCFIFNQQRK